MLPVPEAVAAGGATSAESTIPLGQGSGRLRPREVQADCQPRLVGGQNNPSSRRAGHEQRRVSPGERKLIHDAVSEMVAVGAHEVPPRSGLPNRDQHRGCPHLLPKRSPHFPDQAEKEVNIAILALPLLSKGIDAGRAPCCRIRYILPPFIRREFGSFQAENKGMGGKGGLVTWGKIRNLWANNV